MKQKFIFLILITSTVLFLSCSKEKTAPETPEENPEEIPDVNAGRLKSYTRNIKNSGGNTLSTYNLSYDDKNRISTITVPEDPRFKIVFKYHTADLYSREEQRDGVITEKRDFYLKNSRLDSVTAFIKIKDTTSGKYQYNDKNQLSRVDYYSHYMGPQHFLTELYNYDASGKLINYAGGANNFTFEYHADLVYDLPVTEPVFPSPKKSNLLKRKTIIRDGTIISSDVQFAYTFDSKNRILTKIETALNGEITTYTYSYL